MDTNGQKISEWCNKDQMTTMDIVSFVIQIQELIMLVKHNYNSMHQKRNIRKQSNIANTQFKPNCAFPKVRQDQALVHELQVKLLG